MSDLDAEGKALLFGSTCLFIAVACAALVEEVFTRNLLIAWSSSLMILQRRATRSGAPVAVAALALSLMWFVPSLPGEYSGRPAIVAAAISVSILVLAHAPQRERFTGSWAPLTAMSLFALYWAGTLLNDTAVAGNELPLMVYMATGAILLLLLRPFPDQTRAALATFAVAQSLLGYAWLVAVGRHAIGGPEGELMSGADLGRPQFRYFNFEPMALVAGDTHLYAVPRAVGVTGEPGLFAIQSVLAVVIACSVWGRTRGGIVVMIGAAAGLLAAQSTAAYLTVPLAIMLGVAISRARFSRRLLVLAGIGASGLLLLDWGLGLVAQKALMNPLSLSDRGFTFHGGQVFLTGAESRISLLAAYEIDGAIAMLCLAGLLVLASAARRSWVTAAGASFLLVVGVAGQPVMFLVGSVLVLSLLVTLSTHTPSANGHRLLSPGKAPGGSK